MFRRDAQGRILSENRLKALRHACDLPVDPSMAPAPARGQTRSDFGPSLPASATFPGTTWQSIGPQPIQAKNLSNRAWGNVAGRISALAIHPSDPSILLLGAATGGIWKSVDAGRSWRPVSDTAPSLATSSIVFAPSNPSMVFAATGEVDSAYLEFAVPRSLGTYLGAGLLRSVDEGETWARIDVDLPPNAILSRVLVSPSDPQMVIVGIYVYQDVSANRVLAGGVYVSSDGGVHFTKTFPHAISDLVQDPGDASRVYLGTGVCSGCEPGGVYLSTDFGRSWTGSLTASSPSAGWTGPIRNVKLGITRAGSGTVLYASVLDKDDSHVGGGIYRSPDGGMSWAKVSTRPAMCPAPPASNQCVYDHWIVPEPGSTSTVYFGSIDLYKSTNAATNWVKLTDNYNRVGSAVPVHPDQHAAAASVSLPGTVYFANDGGLYRTADGGQTFQNLNDTLSLAQFNGVTPHPLDPNFAMGGTQDNGNLRYTGQALWTDRTSGDGGFNLIRRDEPVQILCAHFRAYLQFSSDGGDTFTDATSCDALMDCDAGKSREPMAFYPPATAGPLAPDTIFLGTNRIWSNPTFGRDASAWQPRSESSITTFESDYLTALDVLGDGSGPLWAGSRFGGVFFSTDGGATFTTRTAGLPAAIVTKIVGVTPDGRNAYVAFGGFLGLPSRHIFQTSDAGQTWTNISSNLPDVPITALAIDPTDPSDLFVGTDVGVFRSVNGGASWTSFNQGLPNVSVYGLAFSPSSGDLYAATYGRGMFRIEAPRASSGPPEASFRFSPDPIIAGRAVQFTDTSANAPASWFWSFGDGSSSTLQNPTKTYAVAGNYSVSQSATNSLGSRTASQFIAVRNPGAGVPCAAGAQTICLQENRFKVEVAWRAPSQGTSGVGTAVALTGDTGYFWFFSSNNIELVVKVVDGRAFNNKFWIFSGALSNVEYTVTVTDTTTGNVRSYFNPNGRLASVADISAF